MIKCFYVLLVLLCFIACSEVKNEKKEVLKETVEEQKSLIRKIETQALSIIDTPLVKRKPLAFMDLSLLDSDESVYFLENLEKELSRFNFNHIAVLDNQIQELSILVLRNKDGSCFDDGFLAYGKVDSIFENPYRVHTDYVSLMYYHKQFNLTSNKRMITFGYDVGEHQTYVLTTWSQKGDSLFLEGVFNEFRGAGINGSFDISLDSVANDTISYFGIKVTGGDSDGYTEYYWESTEDLKLTWPIHFERINTTHHEEEYEREQD